MKRLHILIILLALTVVLTAFKASLRQVAAPIIGQKTVAQRLDEFGGAARARLKKSFDNAGMTYPPESVTLVGLKSERVLQVSAKTGTNSALFICSYRILGASGDVGPKLREGDRQVPEGIYSIESLNPNSAFHVSLRIGYPNAFDRARAKEEGRTNLGGDIMIHGDSVSVGCLAMGNEAAEDLFVLAADVGCQNMRVVLAPVDFRTGKTVTRMATLPKWTSSLYAEIQNAMAQLPRANPK